MRSLVSTYAILGAQGGKFVSLIASSRDYCQALAAKSCRNVGTWPVLAGDEVAGKTRSCPRRSASMTTRRSPRRARAISLTGTEIDEILTLRVLTRDGRGETAGGRRGRCALGDCWSEPRARPGSIDAPPWNHPRASARSCGERS